MASWVDGDRFQLDILIAQNFLKEELQKQVRKLKLIFFIQFRLVV